MALKTETINEVEYGVLKDGLPVYVTDDGAENTYDGESLAKQVTAMTAKQTDHAGELSALQNQLKQFEGLDIEAARKALKTVANLDDKTLIDAGKAEEVRMAAVAQVTGQLEDSKRETASANARLAKAVIAGRFAASTFVRDRLLPPPDMVAGAFSSSFAVEGLETDNPRVVAKAADGSPMLSIKNPGQTADFEEAMEILVNARADKDHLYRSDDKPGSGAPGSNGPPPRAKQMTQAEAEQLAITNPKEMQTRMLSGEWDIV